MLLSSSDIFSLTLAVHFFANVVVFLYGGEGEMGFHAAVAAEMDYIV